MNRIVISAVTLVVAACLSFAQFPPLPPAYDVRGNVPSVNISCSLMDGYVSAQLTPIDYGGKQAYLLLVNAQKFLPMGSEYVQLDAIAPANAVSRRGGDAYGVDLDIPQLLSIRMLSGMRCDWMTGCMPYIPTSVPFKGSFAPYTGMNSQSMKSSGHDEIIMRTPMFIQQIKSSGGRSSYTAVFTGVVATFTLGPTAWGSNAMVSEFTGNTRISFSLPPTAP